MYATLGVTFNQHIVDDIYHWITKHPEHCSKLYSSGVLNSDRVKIFFEFLAHPEYICEYELIDQELMKGKKIDNGCNYIFRYGNLSNTKCCRKVPSFSNRCDFHRHVIFGHTSSEYEILTIETSKLKRELESLKSQIVIQQHKLTSIHNQKISQFLQNTSNLTFTDTTHTYTPTPYYIQLPPLPPLPQQNGVNLMSNIFPKTLNRDSHSDVSHHSESDDEDHNEGDSSDSSANSENSENEYII